MYVCICMYVCIYMHVCIYACICMYVRVLGDDGPLINYDLLRDMVIIIYNIITIRK